MMDTIMSGATYGIGGGLIVAAFRHTSLEMFLVGLAVLAVAICASRIVAALKQARGEA